MGRSVPEPSGVEAYVLGREYGVMPIPMDPDHCVEVPAGPVALVVEARVLTQEAIVANEERQHRTDGVVHEYGALLDGGVSLHVVDAVTRLEYLRFDCFEQEPHYHYIRNDEQRNVVVRLDDVAEGDAVEWALGRLVTRLPEMLEFAHGVELAAAVRETADLLPPAVDRVRQLVAQVADTARRLRESTEA